MRCHCALAPKSPAKYPRNVLETMNRANVLLISGERPQMPKTVHFGSTNVRKQGFSPKIGLGSSSPFKVDFSELLGSSRFLGTLGSFSHSGSRRFWWERVRKSMFSDILSSSRFFLGSCSAAALLKTACLVESTLPLTL